MGDEDICDNIYGPISYMGDDDDSCARSGRRCKQADVEYDRGGGG